MADRRACRAVRKHWRLCHGLGVPYVPQAHEALRRLQRAMHMADGLAGGRQSVKATRWKLSWCPPSDHRLVEVLESPLFSGRFP